MRSMRCRWISRPSLRPIEYPYNQRATRISARTFSRAHRPVKDRLSVQLALSMISGIVVPTILLLRDTSLFEAALGNSILAAAMALFGVFGGPPCRSTQTLIAGRQASNATASVAGASAATR